MRITAIREKTARIASPIANAYIDFSQMTCSVVAVHTDVVRDGQPVVGYGFTSNGRYGQGAVLRERFIPRILSAEPASLVDEKHHNLDPHKIWARMMMNEKPGGHGERSVAVGAVDMAVWDAVAKIAGQPLFQLLADRYGNGHANPRVFVYAAGGYYYPGKDLDALRREMRGYLDRGYTVVKMKIGGAPLDEDRQRIEAVLAELAPGQRLAVDANGRFDLPTAIRYGEMMAPYKLFWYEEAGDPLDYALQAELGKYYDQPMATGENLFSTQDVENLVRFGGFRAGHDIIQIDPPQAYGIGQYAQTVDMLAPHGWPRTSLLPHGGNQMSLAIAAGFGLGGAESYPGVFGDFGGFADNARVENGAITLSERPGVGFEGQAGLYKIMRDLAA